jgi:hypothetical protein
MTGLRYESWVVWGPHVTIRACRSEGADEGLPKRNCSPFWCLDETAVLLELYGKYRLLLTMTVGREIVVVSHQLTKSVARYMCCFLRLTRPPVASRVCCACLSLSMLIANGQTITALVTVHINQETPVRGLPLGPPVRACGVIILLGRPLLCTDIPPTDTAISSRRGVRRTGRTIKEEDEEAKEGRMGQ